MVTATLRKTHTDREEILVLWADPNLYLNSIKSGHSLPQQKKQNKIGQGNKMNFHRIFLLRDGEENAAGIAASLCSVALGEGF